MILTSEQRWADQSHHVLLADGQGRISSSMMARGLPVRELADGQQRVCEPASSISLSSPHGLVVETVIERGLAFYVFKPRAEELNLRPLHAGWRQG
jgi:hypothetical protein